MLFPAESTYELRRRLAAQIKSGAMTETDACRQALDADPLDSFALASLELDAEDAGDLVTAEAYARRYVQARPSRGDAYFAMVRVLSKQDPESPLANAYLYLALDKLLLNEDDLEHFNVDGLVRRMRLDGILKDLPRERVLRVLISSIKRRTPDEPEAVAHELEPYRLIHALQEAGEKPLDRETVDRILRRGQDSAPLLLGILREYADESLDSDTIVERALALLGEIGDPQYLAPISEFLMRDEEEPLVGPAGWAFRRIVNLRPSEAAGKIRELIAAGGSAQRVALAQEIAHAREALDAPALLSGITEGAEGFPWKERESMVVGAIAAAHQVEGRNSPLAAALERRFGGVISRKSRLELRELVDELEVVNTLTPPLQTLTIYQICCQDPGETEEFGGEEHPDDESLLPRPFVRERPVPGRNEPCWCGSGKKYKKCHLDEDSRA